MASKRRPLSERERAMAKMMQRQGTKCAGCDKMLPTAFHVDHVDARFVGGKDEALNYQALCGSCHAEKTARERKEHADLLSERIKQGKREASERKEIYKVAKQLIETSARLLSYLDSKTQTGLGSSSRGAASTRTLSDISVDGDSQDEKHTEPPVKTSGAVVPSNHNGDTVKEEDGEDAKMRIKRRRLTTDWDSKPTLQWVRYFRLQNRPSDETDLEVWKNTAYAYYKIENKPTNEKDAKIWSRGRGVWLTVKYLEEKERKQGETSVGSVPQKVESPSIAAAHPSVTAKESSQEKHKIERSDSFVSKRQKFEIVIHRNEQWKDASTKEWVKYFSNKNKPEDEVKSAVWVAEKRAYYDYSNEPKEPSDVKVWTTGRRAWQQSVDNDRKEDIRPGTCKLAEMPLLAHNKNNTESERYLFYVEVWIEEYKRDSEDDKKTTSFKESSGLRNRCGCLDLIKYFLMVKSDFKEELEYENMPCLGGVWGKRTDSILEYLQQHEHKSTEWWSRHTVGMQKGQIAIDHPSDISSMNKHTAASVDAKTDGESTETKKHIPTLTPISTQDVDRVEVCHTEESHSSSSTSLRSPQLDDLAYSRSTPEPKRSLT